ncbi:unnamed protein product, partial [Closterium sp. NIES-53]
WLTSDTAARLAICNHLSFAECAHFGQHRTAQTLYDAVVARYSSPATAALGRLLLPYLFPKLSASATFEDLVSHFRASDARYRAALKAEFLNRNPPPMYITLYFIVTRLPDSLRSVRDHFLSLDPTSLTVDLLEQHLLAAETSAVAVGAARGTLRTPFFEGCSPSPLAPSYASTAAVDVLSTEDVGAASASAKCRSRKGKGGRGCGGGSRSGGGGSSGGSGGSGGGGSGGSGGGGGGVGGGGGGSGGSGGSGSCDSGGGRNGALRGGSGGGQRQRQLCRSDTPSPQQLRDRADQTCRKAHTQHRCFSRLNDASRAEFGDKVERPHLAELLNVREQRSGVRIPVCALRASQCGGVSEVHWSGVEILDLDYDAILFAMYALSASAEGDCYRCVPPDPGIDAAALGASESVLPGTAPAKALNTFTLDSSASRSFFRDSTTLTPLPAPVPVRLADPSGCTVVARSSTVLPCSAVPSGSLSGLHLPLFSTNLVSTAALQYVMITTTTPGGQSVSICTCTRTGHHVATFNRRPRLSLYTLATEPPHVAAFAQVSASEVVSSHDLLRDFCYGEGILHSFTLPDSPQQNGIAERRIGLVMEVARTSMIYAVAPHFLWPFAVRYAAHQLNLWHRVSLPETSPTLRWTGQVGDASVFRVWDSRAFVRNTSADKLSAHAIPCIFLGFPPDAPGWQFYHPTSRLVLPSQDVTFDESAAELGVAEYEGAGSRGAEHGDQKPGGAEPTRVEPRGVEPGGAELEGAESGGAEPHGAASSRGPAGALPSLSPQQLREWLVRRPRLWSGANGAGAVGVGGAGATGGAGGTGGNATTGLGGARTKGTGAAGTGGVGDAGDGDPTEPGAAGAGGPGAGNTGAGGAGDGSIGTGGAGAGAGAGGAGAVDPGGTVRPRPYFVPLLQQVLGVPSSASLTPPLLCPPPDQQQLPLQPPSPLPAPSPYTEQSGGLTERCEPASRPVLPDCTAHRVPRSRPPPVPGTHAMALRPSSVPLRVPLPAPPESSVPAVLDPESDSARATNPTVSCLLAIVVTDPSFESAIASTLVAELLDFGAACRLDYATALVAESASASPPSVGGECALSTDVLEDRQEDFECLAAVVPRFSSMLLAPEGDPDAPDIPTPRSYAEAITGPYSSQWQTAMNAEIASWKSTGTYVDAVPPPRVNIVDGMWIFRVVDYFQTFSRTPKMTTLRVLLHVATQREYELHSLDFSTTFLQGSLHEEIWLRRPPGFTGTTLASLGFAPSTADSSLFLRTKTSLQPFFVFEYVDDLVFATSDSDALTLVKSELKKRHTSTDLGPSALQLPVLLATAPPSDEYVQPSGPYPELVGCLMYLMTCTRPDLAYPLSLLARYVAPGTHRKVHWDAAKRVLRYLCRTLVMGLVLGGRGPVVLTGDADASWVDDLATQRSSHGYTFSLGSGSVSWRSTRSSSILSSCCDAEIYVRAMAAQELRWLTYLLSDLGEQPHSPPVLYVDNKTMIALCKEHRLEHRTKHIALQFFLARELQHRGQLRLVYAATGANTADVFTKALPPSDHKRFSIVLGLVPTLPHLLSA